VTDVTGCQSHQVTFEPQAPVATVARALVDHMHLPGDVAWMLRDDHSSRYLDETRPLGEQLRTGAQVTMTPKAHLG
jgi:hypothetical protein